MVLYKDICTICEEEYDKDILNNMYNSSNLPEVPKEILMSNNLPHYRYRCVNCEVIWEVKLKG